MKAPSLDDLTPCELKVLYWLARGKGCWETSILLECAVGTVKKHRVSIYRTLRVPNAVSAACTYWQHQGDLSEVDD